MIVDTHLHPISGDTQRYPHSPIGGVLAEWAKGVVMTGDDILQQFRLAGVDRAVLVHASTVYGYNNAYAAACVGAHPDYFAGVGCIDPRAPDAADNLTYLIREQGMVGSRVFASGSTMNAASWVESPELDPYWRRAQELGIPVCVQLVRTQLPAIRLVIAKYPGIPFVFDHMAGPRVEDGPPYESAAELLAFAQVPTVYLKITTDSIRHASEGKSSAKDWFRLVVDRFGPDRLLWGSNFPNAKGSPGNGYYKDLVDMAKNAFSYLSASERDAIMGGTAIKLYKLG